MGSTVRRCRQCARHLSDTEFFQSCEFHPGDYLGAWEPLDPCKTGKSGWWTCCAATEKDAQGCVKGRHAQDAALERKLAKLGRRSAVDFPLDAASLGAGPLAPRLDKAALVVAAQPDEVPESNDAPSEFITHRLLPTDTLVGLALHYGTSESLILSLNHLPCAAAFTAKAALRIPYRRGISLPAGHREAVAQAARALGLRRLREAARTQLGERVSGEESRLYLDGTEGGTDWEAAFAELAADVRWERDEGSKRGNAIRRVAGSLLAGPREDDSPSSVGRALAPGAGAAAAFLGSELLPQHPQLISQLEELRQPLLS